MAKYNKRAKWVEGITQSNRILRDIAEIVTTAIQDENGVIREENWELVYPRPFKETIIERGLLIQNPDRAPDGINIDFMPLDTQIETFQLIAGEAVKLQYDTIVPSTLVITSEGGSTTFVKDVDYTYDAENNTITRIPEGSIADGQIVKATYGVRLFSILPSGQITVFKKLVEKNPYRPISNEVYPYTIDFNNGKVVFLDELPPNYQDILLTFTEANGFFKSTKQTRVPLELDLLDPNEKTFVLPSGYGRIREAEETFIVASASGTPTAIGINPYTFDGDNKTVTFRDPIPTQGVKLTITAFMYRNNEFLDEGSDELTFDLVPDDIQKTETPVWKIGATTNKFSTARPHSIQASITSEEYNLEYGLSDLDAGVEIIDPSQYRVDHVSTIITFLDEQDPSTEFQVSLIANGQYDLNEGLSKIKDRIVLKTTTEPEVDVEDFFGIDYGARDTAKSLTMYVEFRKPERLVHPETGMTIYQDYKGTTVTTQFNNHYIEARMFDKWDDMRQQPARDKWDENDQIVERGAYVSDWAKYSWFKDWKEYLKDELDDTPGSGDISKGIILQEVITEGMTEEFPIQFWISTNNNRIAMVLMGDPTLDQDNFLTSFGYFGRIHPFYDSECVVKRNADGTIVLDGDGNPVLEEKRTYFENDVKGNFALTVGSSTIPAAVGQPPTGQPVIVTGGIRTQPITKPVFDEQGQPVLDENGNPVTEIVSEPIAGDLYDGTVYSYLVTYLTTEGESKPSTPYNIVAPFYMVDDSSGAVQKKGISNTITIRLPEEATGYRIYRAWAKAGLPVYKYRALKSLSTYNSYPLVGLNNTNHKSIVEGKVYEKVSSINTPWTNYDSILFEEIVEYDYSLNPDIAGDYNNYKLMVSVEQLNTMNREFVVIDDGEYLSMESSNNTPVNSNHTQYNSIRGAAKVARGFEAVTRDPYTGAILDVKFSTRYGRETATGVNDVSMFQTRSGLKYQRHNAAFITTEEFMRKERSGQSRWTGKFHLSPIYLEHSYDKQRGWFDGVMAVDDAGIEHLDELIVNKDTPNEEVYKFFRINAPYSFFNNSPNYSFGVAIIKSSMKWK